MNTAGSKPIAAGYLAGDSGGQKLGGFLEHCHHCRKRIAKDSDVFMYGDLRAFCSIECRDHQMAQDQSAVRKKRETSKVKK